MSALSISMAFLMGLTGSLHCAGMCGPIIWVMPFQAFSGFRKWMGLALYHFGRVTVYALLGVILHSFTSLFHPQWQQYISIGMGAVLLLFGLLYFVPGNSLQVSVPWVGFVKNSLGKLIGRPGLWTLFASGILNGLLPCGLVYMALSASTIAATPLQTMILMYAFGLGTVPMLVALTIMRSKAGFIKRMSLRKLVPVVMFIFGALFMIRGMNLGVPYLSPKISIEKNEVKASCCHKQ